MDQNSRNEVIRRLSRSFFLEDQVDIRKSLPRDEDYYADILKTYMSNPFLGLTDDERSVLAAIKPAALGQLIAARDAASRSRAPKHVVFCMPKSGSSFVQSALRHALELPMMSLTGFGSPSLTLHFGMNPREQELDEMAVARAVLLSSAGFVAQHHTRFTLYLGRQMIRFGMNPIVTVRNLFDCIVSFDEMMMAWRLGGNPRRWGSDAQFALPAGYPDLEPAERYRILAPSYGIWLLNFYLSWKRAQVSGLKMLLIRYEDHVLHPERLVETLAEGLQMTEGQRERLAAYVRRPDPEASRLNVGRRGRGVEQIPYETRRFLSDYAAMFRDELDDADLEYLVPDVRGAERRPRLAAGG